MTNQKDTIRKLLKDIPKQYFRGRQVATPWGMMHEINNSFVEETIAKFSKDYPKYKFRLIECHDEPRTYSAITIDDPDPREMGEMEKYGDWDSEGYYTRFEDKS